MIKFFFILMFVRVKPLKPKDMPLIFRKAYTLRPYGLKLIRYRDYDYENLKGDELYKYIYTLCEYTTQLLHYLCVCDRYTEHTDFDYYSREYIVDFFSMRGNTLMFISYDYTGTEGHVFCYAKINGFYYKVQSSLDEYEQETIKINKDYIKINIESLQKDERVTEIYYKFVTVPSDDEIKRNTLKLMKSKKTKLEENVCNLLRVKKH